jgi:multicomponent Na+:H+ antiporter subunit G
MELVLDIITGICFFVGSLSIFIGACGLIKLPDVFSRIHAAGMIDTGGTAFFLLGMIFQTGWSLITVKLILIGIFIFFTSPVTSHVTANLARQKNLMPIGKKIGKLL